MQGYEDCRWEDLLKGERERALLGAVAGVLAWDERTYLPRRGVAQRGEQLALLARLAHERLLAPELAELLDELEEAYSARPPDDERRATLREIRRLQQRATRLPPELVEALSRLATRGQAAWEEAKKHNRFADFLEPLTEMIRLKREEAHAIGFAGEPYDALLDEYEPGLTTAEASRIISGLGEELAPILRTIMATGQQMPVEILHRRYPVETQRLFGQAAAAALGFDFHSGRLDVTAHPFCSGHGPGDVRLTTRYNERHFSEGFFGILHETGHGLYEQNLPAAWWGTPLGTAASLGLHESQSRLWENLVGRGRPFWEYFYPQAQRFFVEALGDVPLHDFYAAINDVRPSFIRIEADEVTYNLHIVLRFELERELIANRLQPADLPAAWNERFKNAFGLVPPDDAHGCLQDIHWSAGLFGYFPTYTLGNLFSAQFMAQARNDLGDLDAALGRGEFQGLKGWLVEKIHRHGARYRAMELVQRVTGRQPGHAAFVDYLKQKYFELYCI
jgi:carboxypeptidase Taq